MVTPILATKLFIPPPRPNAVVRPRLLERLNAGLQRAPGLTLISAPAGFGKTTLVSTWIKTKDEGGRIAARDESEVLLHPSSFILHPFDVAWLSLDEGDSDPNRFGAYLIAAVQTAVPGAGAGLREMLQSSQPPPAETLLTALLNEMAGRPDNIVLVLDDYHVIAAPAVDQALTFLVEHLPPRWHLVITTREDPPLPLARLRARGQLTELRAADLRFTPAEAAEFLNQVMGLGLVSADITALEDRTEGWIAGLQLAALSMQGQPDVSGFIRAFAGDHRYIVDYLVEEVLQRQPEAVRRFLLQTAILDRLTGALCEAVTAQANGQAQLEALERGNFFVTPLDDQRHWYRYHHLFAEVLQAHLRTEQPEAVSTLHRRASRWYEQQGAAENAIRHALAAQDFERAADLIERAVPAMNISRQEAIVLGWLRALPRELFAYRPVLSVHYAWALLTSGQLEGVDAHLQAAERWLNTPPNSGQPADPHMPAKVVVDETTFRALPGMIAVYRAAQAQARGEVGATVAYARQALDLIPEDNHLGRGAAASLLGLAAWTSGELEAAYRSYAEGMARLRQAGNIADAIGCAVALADIRLAQGRLREATRIYHNGLQLAAEQGAPNLRGTADMHVGLSERGYEHNDLAAAAQHLLTAQALGVGAGLPRNPYRWCVAMARVRQAQGDLDGALELLGEAERLYVSDYFPNVHPVGALKTRVWIAQGRLEDAFGWVREQGLSVDDPLSYLHECEHLTLARVLLAQPVAGRAASSAPAAAGLLGRLLPAAEAGGRTGSVIEILLMQALALQAQGRLAAALALLNRALTLAEPEGYVRTFVDEGAPLAALLAEAAKQPGAFHSIRQLQAAMGGAGDRTPANQTLVEPLTGRELELLRLLGTSLTGPEIAQQLMVSLNTVRTHTRNVYTKLEVNDRRAAVRRAEALGLL